MWARAYMPFSPPKGDTWTLDWTPERTGDYSIRARAMDNRLEEGLSEMLHVRVTTDGTGTPHTTNPHGPSTRRGPLSVAEGAGALIEVTGFRRFPAPPAYVAIYRDGVWLMDARRLGTQARWVAELPTGIIGRGQHHGEAPGRPCPDGPFRSRQPHKPSPADRTPRS